MNQYVTKVYEEIESRYPYEKEYLQALKEILESLDVAVSKDKRIEENNLLERFVIPERIIQFKVEREDDNGKIQVNNGYRVQFNSAIGPYKGGLRFHPSVNLSILKFLGLEQCLKNSLTTLPMGGAKGGSDFDPKGKSDREIMRFCKAFMSELYRHIGQFRDVPAGDIGVGAREIGYLYGEYKRLTNESVGVLTGKGISFGGSLARTEATGYGLCYFTNKALEVLTGKGFAGKTVCISGSGNVAIFATEKAIQLGNKVVTLSDSNGWIYDSNGIDLNAVKGIKLVKRGRIKEYLDYHKDAIYHDKAIDKTSLWSTKCDIALPCATQNELNEEDAKALVKNGVIGVFEGANMPTTFEAYHYLLENGVIYGPGKAANAGGVAVSGLEMAQNSMRYSWSFEEVDKKLKDIMEGIFANIYETAKIYGVKANDLITPANIAGFKKIADAMIAQGF